jgi:hypothetical protein
VAPDARASRRRRSVRASFAFVPPPRDPVTRVGRLGSDLWQPNRWDSSRRKEDDGTFGYRFDDPGDLHDPPIPDAEKFRIIYCSTELTGAVCEVAAREIPTQASLADHTRQPPSGIIDEDWCRTRAAGYTLLDPGLVFVDVAARATSNALNEASAISLLAAQRGYNDIDPALLRGPDRRFTQEVARYIYEQTSPGAEGLPGQPTGAVVAGIRYLSRHGDAATDYECWATFDTRMVHYRREDVPLTLRVDSLVATSIREAALYLGLEVEDPS